MTMVEDVSGEHRGPGVGGWDVVLSIVVAFNLAVTQPILDLTGRFPQFFLARRSPRIDLVLLAFGLAIAIPGVTALIVWLVGKAARRAGTTLHVIVVGALTASLGMQVLERLPGLKSAAAPVLVAASVVVGGFAVFAFYRSRSVRTFVRLTAVSAVLLPALFLFSSPASKLVIRQSAAISGSTVIGNPVPVVMVVLDELPVASLMDESYGIDAEMFPSFGRLAATSTWFRNATSVHDFTDIAVPAILTGNLGDKHKLPIATHYPKNVFTLLGGAYDVHASEAFTQLCPVSICTSTSKPAPAFAARWKSLAKDLRVIYEHVVAPPSFEDRLPSIDQTWGDFGGTGGKPASADPGKAGKPGVSADPVGEFRAFNRSIAPAQRPSLWVLHVELPHAPWKYLPTGQRYPQTSPIPGRVGQIWGADEWLITQAYQRHLLQTAAADRELGRLIDRLRTAGLWDRALVMVTADHGVSFRSGSDLRIAAKETTGEIAAVPMFVKKPGQTTAEISDRPVETIDLVPTIADVLDVEGMYATEGVSVFADGATRTAREMRAMRGHRVSLGVDEEALRAAVRRKIALFGSSGGIERVYAATPGPYRDLLGRSIATASGTAPGRVVIDSGDAYDRFDPAAGEARFLMTGRLTGVPGDQPVLAVAVGGKVVAVTRGYVRGGGVRFQAMLPPGAFRKGANAVAVYLVSDGAGGPFLRRIASAV